MSMKTMVAVGVVTLAIVFHALFPRYEWRDVRGVPIMRVDRWTGHAEIGRFVDGQWQRNAVADLRDLVK
jgi:hypothetical protein